MSTGPNGQYGVSLSDAVRRFPSPGESSRSSVAEVGALLFFIGLVLGFGAGSIW